MSQLFPESFIQEVIDRNSLEDVVSSYVQLKRSGSTLKGLCPFHREKSPSFSVSADKQLYHCFGCGAGGTVINFVMQTEHLDFVEAVRLLADRAGLDVPETSSSDRTASHEIRKRLYEVNRDAAKFFCDKLFEPEGSKALDYVKSRELTPETVKRFGIGYSPANNGLTVHLRELGYDDDTMLLAGLLSTTDSGRLYERFINRLMFPIIDRRRNVIGFGGRVLDDSKPKYLNTSDTPAFNKSRNLYALNLAGKSDAGYLLLVEGYMDVIALHQAGITSAAATLGTALTEEQSKVIKQIKNEVVIAYDSDEAGQAATRRAIEILAERGLNIRVLVQKDCKDPDDYIKKYGAGAYKQLIADAPVQIEYKISKLKKMYDLNQPHEKLEYIKALAVELARFESEVEREIYVNKTADETGVSSGAIFSEIARVMEKTSKKRQFVRSDTSSNTLPIRSSGNPERLLLSIMSSDGNALKRVFERITPEDFPTPATRALAKALHEKKEPGTLTADPDFGQEIVSILFDRVTVDNLNVSVDELVTALLIERNKEEQKRALESGDIALLAQLIQQRKEVGKQ